MIRIDIPGGTALALEHILLDYNGTIAADGILAPSTAALMRQLSELAHVAVLTADTYGTVREQCASLGVDVHTYPQENAGQCKEACIKGLAGDVACLGNGRNDIGMFEQAALSIAIIDAEGACAALLAHADIVARSMDEGLALLLHPDRIRATLRS